MNNAKNWVRVPGRGRYFKNTKTGEVITRRQYDRRFGRLAARGFASNEAQAKANKAANPAAQLLRPARGRHKGLPRSAKSFDMSNVRPLGNGQLFRTFYFPLPETDAEWRMQANMLLNTAARNNKINDVIFGLVGYKLSNPTEVLKPYTKNGLQKASELTPEYVNDQFVNLVQEYNNYAEFKQYLFHIRFKATTTRRYSASEKRKRKQAREASLIAKRDYMRDKRKRKKQHRKKAVTKKTTNKATKKRRPSGKRK
ncbi:MAG: hypothetical protein ACREGF_01230 [Candidatus Saccharimonadales bacterium]